jgi:anti-sigma regulatory factor (Ser/Thr protein kinase)
MIRVEESDRLSLTLLLSPEDGSVAQARHHLHEFLTSRDVVPERIDPTDLVVSELVTNAIEAGSPEIEVYARVDGDAVRVWVSDAVPLAPQAHTPSPHGGGWGLHIIHEVATRWGVRPRVDGHPGKTVWAEVLLT